MFSKFFVINLINLFYKVFGVRNYSTLLKLAVKDSKKRSGNTVININRDNTHCAYYDNKPYEVYSLKFTYDNMVYAHRKDILRQVMDRKFDPSKLEEETTSMIQQAEALGLVVRLVGLNVKTSKT